MRGAVLLIGDELLGGVVPDRNLAAAARELGPRGVGLVRVETVPDIESEIAEAAHRLAAVADLVVACGGLGPTDDDRTRAAFAAALGTAVHVDDGKFRELERRMVERGYPGGEAAARQCSFPGGTEPVANPVGSAWGFRGRLGRAEFWVLPGVPAEAQAMLRELAAALPVPADRDWERLVGTAGRGETQVAARLADAGFRAPEGIGLAYLPAPGGVRLRLFAPGGAARMLFDAGEAALRTALAEWALPDADLARSLLRAMGERGLTLATAESCTGGLIGARITDVPGSSSVYLGGTVAYADRIKTEQLGVSRDLLAREGAVSEAVACALASGVRERFGADLAVSVTGIAGPGGGTPEKPVGTVWIGRADRGGAEARLYRFWGPRDMIRERTVNKALEMAYRHVREPAG